MRFPLRYLLALACLLFMALLLGHAAAPPGPPVRRGQDGDPLPAGAVARLGTTRFRVASDVRDVRLAPDGKTVAVMDGGQLRLLDATSGLPVPGFRTEQDVELIAFSPTGDALIGADRNAGHLRVLCPATGRLLRTIGTKYNDAFTLDISKGGKIIALGCYATDGAETRAYELSTGRLLASSKGGECLALSADGRTLACWNQHGDAEEGTDHLVRILDVGSGKKVRTIRIPSRPLLWGALAPDGKTLAVATEKRAIELWDVRTGKRQRSWRGRSDGALGGIVFSPDGAKLLVWWMGDVWGWDLHGGTRLLLPKGPLGRCCDLVFTPDGRGLAVNINSRQLIVWNVFTGLASKGPVGHEDRVTSLAFARDGASVWSVDGQGTIIQWGLEGAILRKRNVPCGWAFSHSGWFRSGGPVLAQDGLRLAGPSRDEPDRMKDFPTLGVWQTVSGEKSAFVSPRGVSTVIPAFSTNGLLAIGGLSEEGAWAHVCKADSGEKVASVALPGLCDALAFGPGGKTLAVLVQSANLEAVEARLYNATTGKAMPGFKPFRLALAQSALLTFAPDGRFFALSCEGLPPAAEPPHQVPPPVAERSIVLIDAAMGTPGWSLPMTGRRARALAFAPDSRSLAVGALSDDGLTGTVELWEVSTGKRRWCSPPVSPITTLAFAPDGRRLASGHANTTVLLWDVTGRLLSPRPTDAKRLWTELGSPDAAVGYRAIHALTAQPDAIALLRERIKLDVRKPLAAAEVARLIAELDAEDFATRERAHAVLVRERQAVIPALRLALEQKPSLEAVRRIEWTLTLAASPLPPAEDVRPLRAVEALEWVGTAEARALLRELARGRPGAPLTSAAEAALARLARPAPAKGDGMKR